MAVSDQLFVLALSTEVWRLEHIPSSFKNIRNVVIKQPVGDYPPPALLRPPFDVVFMSRRRVGSVLFMIRGIILIAEQQIHHYPLEFPVCNDHTEIRACSCCWLHDRDQAPS